MTVFSRVLSSTNLKIFASCSSERLPGRLTNVSKEERVYIHHHHVLHISWDDVGHQKLGKGLLGETGVNILETGVLAMWQLIAGQSHTVLMRCKFCSYVFLKLNAAQL